MIEADHGEETDDVDFDEEHLLSHDVEFWSDATDDPISATKIPRVGHNRYKFVITAEFQYWAKVNSFETNVLL